MTLEIEIALSDLDIGLTELVTLFVKPKFLDAQLVANRKKIQKACDINKANGYRRVKVRNLRYLFLGQRRFWAKLQKCFRLPLDLAIAANYAYRIYQHL